MFGKDYYEIQPFKKEDIKEIVEISYKFWKKNGIYSISFYNQRIIEQLSFVLKINNKLVGCCLCENLGNRISSISLLMIDDIYQNQGFGKFLLNYCLEHLKYKGFIFCQLHVCTTNYKAMNLYEKFGFERMKFVKNYYINEKDKDAFIMGRYLNNNNNYKYNYNYNNYNNNYIYNNNYNNNYNNYNNNYSYNNNYNNYNNNKYYNYNYNNNYNYNTYYNNFKYNNNYQYNKYYNYY